MLEWSQKIEQILRKELSHLVGECGVFYLQQAKLTAGWRRQDSQDLASV